MTMAQALEDEKQTYKFKKFERLVSAPTVDLDALREISWNGIPTKYRALTWQLLLGYSPTNSHRRAATIQRKRSEYMCFSRHYSRIDFTKMTAHDQETLRQVQADVPRTASKMKLFRNQRIQFHLERLLFTFAMRHPGLAYSQGMDDLAVPLIALFLGEHYNGAVTDDLDMTSITDEMLSEVEADAYWCLSSIIAEIQDHYTPDQPGIQRMTFRFEELIKRVDPGLHSHFVDKELEISFFSFQWMNCLFVRELPLRCIFRVWDTYLSEEDRGFDAYHVNVCAAYLLRFSSQLKKMKYEEMFFFVQNLPTTDWNDEQIELLLSQAFVWRSSLEDILDREIMRKDPRSSRGNAFKQAIQRLVETTSNIKSAQMLTSEKAVKQTRKSRNSPFRKVFNYISA